MTKINLLYFFHLFILHTSLLSIVIPKGQLHKEVQTQSKTNNAKT